MADIRQALVAIGGRASRLRRDLPVDLSKSFLRCGPHTMLDLCLWSLSTAGIERVLLAYGREVERRRAVELVEPRHPDLDIRFFRDAGVGVHGIPHQARHLLDDAFIFEAGHGVSSPEHHRGLILLKQPGNVVFSAFRPAEGNRRYEVVLREELPGYGRRARTRSWALAHPMAVDREYAARIATLGFEVNRVARDYDRRGSLVALRSEMPVEFDTYCEYRRVTNLLEQNMLECRNGTPWLEDPLHVGPATDLHLGARLLATEDGLPAHSTRTSENSHSLVASR